MCQTDLLNNLKYLRDDGDEGYYSVDEIIELFKIEGRKACVYKSINGLYAFGFLEVIKVRSNNKTMYECRRFRAK
jgi:hypothetical protein